MTIKDIQNLVIGETSFRQAETPAIEVERHLGEAVFKDGENGETKMVGIYYNSADSARFGQSNADVLVQKNMLSVTKDNIVVVRNPLDIETVFADLSEKRKGGQNYSLNDYFKDNNIFVRGEQFTSQDFFRRLGFNPERDVLQKFVDTSIAYGKRYLIPEIIREVIFTALIQEPRYKLLTGGRPSRALTNPESEIPEVLYSGDSMLMEDIGEAENLPSVEISYQSRKVRVYGRGVRVPINNKVIKYVPFPVLQESLRQIGIRLANQESDLCIDTLLNGDKPNAGYPAGVMGVYTVSSKIAYKDILGLMLRYSQIAGYLPNVALANETELIRLLTTSDFMKTDKNAQALFEMSLVDGDLTRSIIAVPSDEIAASSMLFVDTRRAVQHLVFEGLTVAEDFHNRTEQHEFFVRMATGFENIDQGAKVVMDGSVCIADYPIPSYLSLRK